MQLTTQISYDGVSLWSISTRVDSIFVDQSLTDDQYTFIKV